jgi:uncharacterized membrane protein YidH (DUF202 family)
MSSVGSELYTDSANLGRFTSNIMMYVMFFIGIVMVIGGVVVYNQKPKPPSSNIAGAKTDDPKKAGVMLIGFGILLAGMGYINYYLSRKSKLYAAGQGVADVINIFRR